MSNKKKVQCFIDGFNLYHAIDDLKDNSLKWLNLRLLSEAYIQKSKEELKEVFYFSAFATWKEEAYRRHKAYVKALKASGITNIIGHFKEKQKKCIKCGTRWTAHEEKESDVNLALYIVQQAYEDNYDKALIITADSDICPAIKMVKKKFPNKELMVLTPPNRYRITRELRDLAQTQRIKQKHLQDNLLKPLITLENGEVITLPDKYKKS